MTIIFWVHQSVHWRRRHERLWNKSWVYGHTYSSSSSPSKGPCHLNHNKYDKRPFKVKTFNETVGRKEENFTVFHSDFKGKSFVVRYLSDRVLPAGQHPEGDPFRRKGSTFFVKTRVFRRVSSWNRTLLRLVSFEIFVMFRVIVAECIVSVDNPSPTTYSVRVGGSSCVHDSPSPFTSVFSQTLTLSRQRRSDRRRQPCWNQTPDWHPVLRGNHSLLFRPGTVY